MTTVRMTLTDEQRKQISDATGRSITELTVEAGSGELNEKELAQVSAGLGRNRAGGDPSTPSVFGAARKRDGRDSQ